MGDTCVARRCAVNHMCGVGSQGCGFFLRKCGDGVGYGG